MSLIYYAAYTLLLLCHYTLGISRVHMNHIRCKCTAYKSCMKANGLACIVWQTVSGYSHDSYTSVTIYNPVSGRGHFYLQLDNLGSKKGVLTKVLIGQLAKIPNKYLKQFNKTFFITCSVICSQKIEHVLWQTSMVVLCRPSRLS